MIRLNRNDNR